METIVKKSLSKNKEDFFNDFSWMSKLTKEQFQYLKSISISQEIEKRRCLLNEMRNNYLSVKSKNLEVFQKLSGNFFPPFDREDLISVTISFRSINKKLYDLARRIVLYSADIASSNGLFQLTELLEKIVKYYSDLVDLCKNFKKTTKMIDLIVQMNKQIYGAIELSDESILDLFDEKLSEKNILKYKEIFQNYQSFFQYYLELGQVIEGMIVKYA